jgi:hypothetical protein
VKIDKIDVIDADKGLILHVIDEDIKKAGKRSPATCAAAQACIRQMKVKAALVHLGRTYVLIKNKWLRYRTPLALRTEIVSFDRGGTFAPGDYMLQKLQPSHQGTGYRQGGETTGSTGSGPRRTTRPRHYITDVRFSMRDRK